MAILRNKDNEVWDNETGFVYDEDGKVVRPGIGGTKALTPAEVKRAIKGGEE
jgi:hypothetical protein